MESEEEKKQEEMWEFTGEDHDSLYYRNKTDGAEITIPIPDSFYEFASRRAKEISDLQKQLADVKHYRLDESKASILEKDVEDYLYQNPNALMFSYGRIEKWIKRQFQVPSGIIDLLGVSSGHLLSVVEIKNTAIDSGALTQVCRYAYDLESVVAVSNVDLIEDGMPWPEIQRIVVGRSIDTKTMREAESLGIVVYTFSVNLYLDIPSPMHWTREFRDQRNQQYQELGQDTEINHVLAAYKQSYIDYKSSDSDNPPF